LVEPMAALAVAATATQHAALGTCVLQLPLRDPATVARQANTLQHLSEGRFVLGLGVGSHPGEYEVAGVDYSRRGRLLDQGIASVTALWRTAGDPDHRYRLEPETTEIPIWLAGSSDAAVQRAARVADGWVPMFIPPPEYAQRHARLGELAHQAGRRPSDIIASVLVIVRTGESREAAAEAGTRWLSELYSLPPKAFERHLVAGTPEDCAAAIAAYREAGADHVVVMVAGDEAIEHFGQLMGAAGTSPSARTGAQESNLVPLGPLERLGVAP
ncbi:MAG: LLM class flavin-dependent oxidoreductase, partial [Acidimicrobiales bacterium]